MPSIYFRGYPTVNYVFDDKTYSMVDLFKFFPIKKTFKLDGMTLQHTYPEFLNFSKYIDEVYGTTYYEWIFFLLNGIVDPNFDIPLDTNRLQSQVEKKYPGLTVFFIGVETGFEIGETVTTTSATGVVHSWNPTYRSLVLTDTTGTWETALMVTGQTSGAVGHAGRVVLESKYALHHFELQDGDDTIVVDPYALPPGSTEDTYLDGYINPPYSAEYVVSNYDYEERLNDTKRTVNVLIDDFIVDVENKFEAYKRR